MSPATLDVMRATFPELDWLSCTDWARLDAFADWGAYLTDAVWCGDVADGEDADVWRALLASRDVRIRVRSDVRSYYGVENVPNVNDPDDPTTA